MSTEEPLTSETHGREDYKALLEAKEQELQRIKQKLSKAEKELEKYTTSNSQPRQSGNKSMGANFKITMHFFKL